MLVGGFAVLSCSLTRRSLLWLGVSPRDDRSMLMFAGEKVCLDRIACLLSPSSVQTAWICQPTACSKAHRYISNYRMTSLNCSTCSNVRGILVDVCVCMLCVCVCAYTSRRGGSAVSPSCLLACSLNMCFFASLINSLLDFCACSGAPGVQGPEQGLG